MEEVDVMDTGEPLPSDLKGDILLQEVDGKAVFDGETVVIIKPAGE
jgi:hypothetical protein